jgi:hypothetical protein
MTGELIKTNSIRHPARHTSLFAAMYHWSLAIDITGCNSNPEKEQSKAKDQSITAG